MNKKLRTLLVVLLVLVMVFAFVACGEDEEKTLTIDKTEISLVGIGATEQITAKLNDEVALDGITWTSSKPGYAKVVNGLVIAGEERLTTKEQTDEVVVTITASYGEGTNKQTKTCNVTVEYGFNIILDKTSINLSSTDAANNEYVINPIVQYPNANTPAFLNGCTFSSNDDAVASVDADGKITANGTGVAIITVTTKAVHMKDVTGMGGAITTSFDAATATIVVGVDIDGVAMAARVGVYSATVAWESAYSSGGRMYELESAVYTGAGTTAMDATVTYGESTGWDLSSAPGATIIDTVTGQIVATYNSEQYVLDAYVTTAATWHKVTRLVNTVTVNGEYELTLNADGTFIYRANQAKRFLYNATNGTNMLPANRIAYGQISIAEWQLLDEFTQKLYKLHSASSSYYLLEPNSMSLFAGSGTWVAMTSGGTTTVKLITTYASTLFEFELVFEANGDIKGDSFNPFTAQSPATPDGGAMGLAPLPAGVNYTKA